MVSSQTADVAHRAKLLYEQKLRHQLEATSKDKFVAIEPDSGDHFLGTTLSEAIQASRAAHPDRLAFAIRIGHAAAVDILALIRPYREGLAVAAECMFAWYWLADLCEQEGIPFVLGHALYMKAIHGGKVKNDKLDSQKIALLLRGGMLPQAYVYPRAMRATRDLLRRRMHLVHTRAEALAHISSTVSQYNLPPLAKRLHYAANRAGVAEQFTDESTRRMVELDLAVIAALDEQLRGLELYLVRHAKIDDPVSYQLLQTIPGVGQT